LTFASGDTWFQAQEAAAEPYGTTGWQAAWRPWTTLCQRWQNTWEV